MVLGECIGQLHPRLRSYFSEIPEGSHGHGTGIFDVVGTPRRWLWPALAILSRAGILFPVWQHDVPFTVVNSAGAGPHPIVRAVRTFEFAHRPRAMVDEIGCDEGAITDHLGAGRRLVACFAVETVEGALALTSTRVGLRLGRRTLWLARRLAPLVTLEERFDEAEDVQRVSVVVTHPLLGRLYEYAGSFVYEIRRGEAEA